MLKLGASAAALLAATGCATSGMSIGGDYHASDEFATCAPVNWLDAACLPKDVQLGDLSAYLADKPDELKKHYARLYLEGERNAVLNYNRLGLVALEKGMLEDASWAFDQSITLIEAIYAEDEKAKAAKSKFRAESVKDFKGEPYERALAYYYRGLTYLAANEFDSAHAAFTAAEYQDSVSEEDETFASDFAAMTYLAGWSSWCLGDKARAAEEFARAQQASAGLSPPPPGADLLVVAERGSGPLKTRAGKHGELLKFSEGDASITEVRIAAAKEAIAAPEASNVYFQATTRGGRHIDEILKDKAKFKDATDAVGDVGLASGSTLVTNSMYGNGNAASGYAGLGLMMVGLLSKAASESTVPAADTRAWDTVPHAIHVAPIAGSAKSPVSVEFHDASGALVKEAPPMLVTEGKCRTAWARSHLAAEAPPMAPSAALSKQQLEKTPEKFRAEDQAFRKLLLASGA